MVFRRYFRQSSIFLPILFGALAGFIAGYVLLAHLQTKLLINLPTIKTIKENIRCPDNVGGGGDQNLVLGKKKKITTSNFDEKIKDLQNEKSRLATILFNEIRLLCWIMHEPKREQERTAIMETWGKRCHLILFMVGAKDMLATETRSTSPNNSSSTIPSNSRRQIAPNAYVVYLNMDKDHYNFLWFKTRLAFAYIDEHYKNTFDWILKVDDDSYVIVENLRLFLRSKKIDEPFYYGCQYKANAPKGYASGGPGYIISRTNVEKLIKLLKSDSPESNDGCSLTKNKDDATAEDSRMGQCLYKIGIEPGDTRDRGGRFRFSPFTPEMTINHETLESKYNWFWGFSAHKMANGFECCSDTAISFHYIKPTMMRVMEYLIYYIHPFSKREIWNDIYTNKKSINLTDG